MANCGGEGKVNEGQKTTIEILFFLKTTFQKKFFFCIDFIFILHYIHHLNFIP